MKYDFCISNKYYRARCRAKNNICLLYTSGPLVYIALYTVRPVLFFPSIFLNLSASILFGPMLGIVYLLCGGLSSAVLCYALGSLGGGRRLLK